MYIVAWMQADGRFVQDVEDPAQVRPKLRGQPDSLRLAAAQCFCRPPEREITKSDFFHETESLLDLGQKTGCDGLMRVFEFQLVDHARCFAGGEVGELIDCIALHAHVTRRGIQTRAVTTRAFARLASVDPFRLAFCGKLLFQNRLAITVLRCLKILVPDFAEPTAFFAPAMGGIE